jgi:hypothetical protein
MDNHQPLSASPVHSTIVSPSTVVSSPLSSLWSSVLKGLRTNHRLNRIADRLGMVLSGACLVHCLVLPVLLPLVSVTAGEEHPLVHQILALLIVPTTLWASVHGYKHHKSTGIVILLMLGAMTISLGAVFGEEFPAEYMETLVTVLGSALLITGHWLNWKRGECSHAECH